MHKCQNQQYEKEVGTCTQVQEDPTTDEQECPEIKEQEISPIKDDIVSCIMNGFFAPVCKASDT